MTRLAGLLLSALALQICLGLSNVLFGLPLAVAVAHNAGGAALLLTLVLVNYHARTALVRVKLHVGSLAFQPPASDWHPAQRGATGRPLAGGRVRRCGVIIWGWKPNWGGGDAHHSLVITCHARCYRGRLLVFGNLGIGLCAGGAATVNHVVDGALMR